MISLAVGRILQSGQTIGLDIMIPHKQLEAHQHTSVPDRRLTSHTSEQEKKKSGCDLFSQLDIVTDLVCQINTIWRDNKLS